MSALAEALVAAQRRALAALERAYVVCSRCDYDRTGDDPERDERERRDTLGGAESPREGTEA